MTQTLYRANGQKRKQWCDSGHDTWKTGRYANGYCCQCHRERMARDRKQQRVPKPKPETLPISPLREVVQEAAKRYIQSSQPNDHGHRGLGMCFAERYGLTQKTGELAVSNVLSKRVKNVSIDTADRWCVLLGIHPTALWPSEWPLAEANV